MLFLIVSMLFVSSIAAVVAVELSRPRVSTFQGTNNGGKVVVPGNSDFWVHTPYYGVGLTSGFITIFTFRGRNVLAGPFGIAMNEVATGSQYFLQSGSLYSGIAQYTVTRMDGEVEVEAVQWQTDRIKYDNTFIFKNSTPTIEVYTIRTLNLTVSSYAHQICFVFNALGYQPTAYFDANQVIYASSGYHIVDSTNSTYAGYILGSSLNFTITLLDHDLTTGFSDSSIGSSGYNEIQITWYGSGDSGPSVQGGYFVEYAHYLMSLTSL